ncbi:MAG TPA: DoxX family protein [Chloroflexota bacterium]|jgi:hypothetical protein|nr:DoxX family protein [Chloroflexota bacterium]
MTYLLWIVQGLLAVVFLFAGGMKLVTPIEVLAAQMPTPLPEVFVRFIGSMEVLGAVGLILPGLLRIRTDLTPRAAEGLVVIMLGAVMFTPPDQPFMAVLPIVVGALAAFVAYGRRRLAPQHEAPRRSRFLAALQPAS